MSKALLMADVLPPGVSDLGEAEPVVIETGGGVIWLTLDDGTQLIFCAEQLRTAIEAREAEAA